jgi:hypothetical protein
MKTALLAVLLLAVLPVAAQATPADAPLTRSEHNEVIKAGNALLAASMDLRPDGSARTTHQIGGFSNRIEMRGLAIRDIVRSPLAAADAARGVSRRYHATLVCQAHRIWDGPQVAWSDWRESSYGFFPTVLVIEEIRGTLVASARRIDHFTPGIDGAITASLK